MSKDDSLIIIKKDQPTLKQNTIMGFTFAVIFGVSQGIIFVISKIAIQKYDLKISQMVLPQTFMMMIGAFIFGSLNGVRF